MPENKVRELIHETGIPTFPRPKGIPQNYVVSISETGAGMRYTDPIDTGTSIRVMPGKPHSPNLSQQKPYVIQQVKGRAFDRNGKFVSPDSPEAHIPIQEFIYRG